MGPSGLRPPTGWSKGRQGTASSDKELFVSHLKHLKGREELGQVAEDPLTDKDPVLSATYQEQ